MPNERALREADQSFRSINLNESFTNLKEKVAKSSKQAAILLHAHHPSHEENDLHVGIQISENFNTKVKDWRRNLQEVCRVRSIPRNICD